jgi:hypothetical protein
VVIVEEMFFDVDYVVDLLVWKLKGLIFFVGKFLLGKQMFEFLGGFEQYSGWHLK